MQDRLLTLEQVCDLHPWLTLRTLRLWMERRRDNGLASAVVKIGKRTLIMESKFSEWIESKREGVEK